MATHQLFGKHERAVVVATLASVLDRLVETEEAELTHAPDDRVGERGLLPLLGVWQYLGGHEAADRLAQLLVLIVEDEVPTAARVIGRAGVVGAHFCEP